MKSEYKNKILDDLYEIREGEVEKNYLAKYGKPEEDNKADKAEDELINFMKKFIKNEEDMQNLYEKINQFELYETEQMCFWYKPYYKAGFIDAVLLKKQVQEERIENSFFHEYIHSIMQFLEDNRYNTWRKRKDYKAIADKITKIKDKYPNVRTFIEDRMVIELTKEELQAVLEYITLDDDIERIEKIETFKLGIREGISV